MNVESMQPLEAIRRWISLYGPYQRIRAQFGTNLSRT